MTVGSRWYFVVVGDSAAIHLVTSDLAAERFSLSFLRTAVSMLFLPCFTHRRPLLQSYVCRTACLHQRVRKITLFSQLGSVCASQIDGEPHVVLSATVRARIEGRVGPAPARGTHCTSTPDVVLGCEVCCKPWCVGIHGGSTRGSIVVASWELLLCYSSYCLVVCSCKHVQLSLRTGGTF